MNNPGTEQAYDILPLMNYRRGLQRLYAVLTVAYVAVLLFALPADRLKFWQQTQTLEQRILNELRQQNRALEKAGLIEAPKPKPPEKAIPPPPDAVDVPLPGMPFSESRTGKAIWLAGVLSVPPALGYAAIFLVIPWIYRGFRVAKQI